jgi:acyl carrier protein
VIKIIPESFEVEGNKIYEDTAIGDFLNWDSMGQVIIITSLEKPLVNLKHEYIDVAIK